MKLRRLACVIGICSAVSAADDLTEIDRLLADGETVQAIKLLSARVKAGEIPACLRMGELLEEGEVASKDILQSKTLYMLAAREGSAAGAYRLARTLYRELKTGGEPNSSGAWGGKGAFEWCSQAVTLKHVPALTLMGMMYFHGYGVEGDTDQAIALFERADTLEDAEAPYWLAVAATAGIGVPENHSQALQLYRRSAERGWPLGEWRLGQMLRYGVATEVNPMEALHWLLRSHGHGCAFASYDLALAYREGDITEQDPQKADGYLVDAAIGGASDAQWDLAMRFQSGEGARKDPMRALFWMRRAIKSNYGYGDSNAWETHAQEYARSITEDQRKRAEDLAASDATHGLLGRMAKLDNHG